MRPRPLIQENFPLAQFTTLKIGGPARYFAEARASGDVIELMEFSRAESLPVFILGGGSNLLISDDGFAGLVIRIAIKGIEWHEDSNGITVVAGAGEDWDELVESAVAKNLAGIECLSGIPGSVGGTPVQNVGAYGQEVSESIVSVKAFDRLNTAIVDLSNADCRFSYRSSLFNSIERDRYIALSVAYRLDPGGEPALRYPDIKDYFTNSSPTLEEARKAVIEIRSRKGMVIVEGDPDCRSAGSFFKNPIVDKKVFEAIKSATGEDPPGYEMGGGMIKAPAAWLIEHAGFQKGCRRGRAGISSKHTLAIINRGGATAAEVLALVSEIQDRVEDKFGIKLQPEPVFVGIV